MKIIKRFWNWFKARPWAWVFAWYFYRAWVINRTSMYSMAVEDLSEWQEVSNKVDELEQWEKEAAEKKPVYSHFNNKYRFIYAWLNWAIEYSEDDLQKYYFMDYRKYVDDVVNTFRLLQYQKISDVVIGLWFYNKYKDFFDELIQNS